VKLLADTDGDGEIDDVVATTTTSNGGQYLFENLDADDYKVMFGTVAGLTFTTAGAAADEDVDGDSDAGVDGMTDTISLEIGEAERDIDAGLVDPGTASITGRYFCDENDNDVDDGEPGIADATVTLLDAAGAVVATTTTGLNGEYAFTGLPAGDYTVEFAPATDGKVFVAQDDPNGNGDDTNDSDVDSTGTTGVITVGVGEVSENNDAGVEDPGTASLAGRVFCDENDNSLDDGEPGIAGVTVQLLDASGAVVATTETGADGSYEFVGLDAGTYSVDFDENDADLDGKVLVTQDVDGNASDDVDSDASEADGTTGQVTLGIGERVENIDAGVEDPGTASIGDTVWLDENGNGTLDGGEAGVDG
ncbi:hypothetical protein E4Z66_19550, partial [Aliishimia ponticola]